MVAGRRSVSVHDSSSWVFNAMADVYGARPPYPEPLIDALAECAGPRGRIGDLGAGTGHLALPLARRGFDVVAVEPAATMLTELRRQATAQGVSVRAVHATAEATSLDEGSLELAVVADAIHFIDAELFAVELSRVLVRRGAFAVVTSEFADTPFMRAVVEIMEISAPRRPRNMTQAITQVFKGARIPVEPERRYHDETPLDAARLERILRSISFIGPAMNPERTAVFQERIRCVPGPRVWARTLTLYTGRRRR